MAVSDRLRQTGGATREQNPQRRVERHVLVLELALRATRRMVEQRIPQQRVRRRQLAIFLVEIRQIDHARSSVGSPAITCCISARTAERLAAVLIAVHDQQDLRRELREAIEHAARAEVRPAARPDRADAGSRQHRDDRFRNVRQAGDDAVARLDPELAELRGEDAHLAAQLVPRHRGDLVALGEVQQRRESAAGRPAPRNAKHALRN